MLKHSLELVRFFVLVTIEFIKLTIRFSPDSWLVVSRKFKFKAYHQMQKISPVNQCLIHFPVVVVENQPLTEKKRELY